MDNDRAVRLPDHLPGERFYDVCLFADRLAGSTDRQRRNARPRDEHLYGRFSRWNLSRRPADRAPGGTLSADSRADGRRRTTFDHRAHLPALALQSERALISRAHVFLILLSSSDFLAP